MIKINASFKNKQYIVCMICPKCEEGTINKVVLKKNGKTGSLCDFCDALWLEGETIGIMSNHTMRSFSKGEDLEYGIEEINEKNQDHRPIRKIASRRKDNIRYLRGE